MGIPSFITHVSLPLLAAAWAFAALAAALTSQFVFGLHPCDLCILQRYPYAVIAVLGVVGAMLIRRKPSLLLPVCLILAGLFLLDAGIAAYHVGVEQGWIEGPSACSGSATATTLDALRAQLAGAPLVSCKDAAFVFLGLSMAAWNVLYALAGAALVVYRLRKQRITHVPAR